MDKRVMITIDGYKFEVNTIGKLNENEFVSRFSCLKNFNAKIAYQQVKKEYLKLLRGGSINQSLQKS